MAYRRRWGWAPLFIGLAWLISVMAVTVATAAPAAVPRVMVAAKPDDKPVDADSAAVAAEAEKESRPLSVRITAWQETLDRSAAVLAQGRLNEEDYNTLRENLAEVFERARDGRDEAQHLVDTTRELQEALGPAPAANDPPEDPDVARQRQEFARTLAHDSGLVSQVELIATRADILLRTANERRIAQFTENLLRRGPSLLVSTTWNEVPKQWEFVADRINRGWYFLSRSDVAWWRYDLELLAGLALLLVLGRTLRRHLAAGAARDSLPRESTAGESTADGGGAQGVGAGGSAYRRLTIACGEALVFGVLPALLLISVALVLLDLLATLTVPALRNVVIASTSGLVLLSVALGTGVAVLAPGRDVWRVLALDDATAARRFFWLLPAALLLALATAALVYLELALAAPELHATAGFIAKLLGVMAVLAVFARIWPEAPIRLRGTVLLLGLAVLGLALLRYHNLSLYIATQALALLVVGGCGLVARRLAEQGVRTLLYSRRSARLIRLRRVILPTERDQQIFDYAAHALVDIGLLLLGLALLLPVSGIEWSELRAWSVTFLHGFSIGSVTIAPLDILTALLLVSAVLVLTRLVQRRLDETVLQRLQVDRGVRHSIRTGVGYMGVLLALMTGIGALGLNLSSLAMIASALSVGIGFGLQTVVSNFVAGLILLVERPVKVGDWIVIGGKEGLVKRISVRSTEIQTFQRSSVIIPNQELISGAVVNWTHKDKFGRIDIPVGVAYDVDPDQVRAVLLAVATADARVVRTPAPRVLLRDFAASALNFELRCFVDDVDALVDVSSDLRFAILKAFRQHGIDIPFNQQVLHIPQLAATATALATRDDAADLAETPACTTPTPPRLPL